MAAFQKQSRSAAPAASAEVSTPSSMRQLAWTRLLAGPILVLAWLEATCFRKNILEAYVAASPVANLFALRSAEQRAELMAELPSIGYSALRRAGVRLHLIAMLIWRQSWADTWASGRHTHLFIVCDASLQKGAEYIVDTAGVFDDNGSRRWFIALRGTQPAALERPG